MMKTAVIQMNCITYDKKKNFEIAAGLIEKAGEYGAELIVLPELFNTGYCSTERDWELSETTGGETEKFLRKYAEKYSCTIIGGFVEKSDIGGLVYNSLMFVSPGKETGIYRKMYLWGPEKNRFLKGSSLCIWEAQGAEISPQICYELGFSENAKISALNGAEIMIYSSAFGKARLYAWDINSRARAVETGCYILASNHGGSEDGLEFCGHSRIVDPQGNVLCEAENDNDVIMADIDIEKVYGQRNDLPYLRDINTEFIFQEYGKIKK